jgi:hypothetical protein
LETKAKKAEQKIHRINGFLSLQLELRLELRFGLRLSKKYEREKTVLLLLC